MNTQPAQIPEAKPAVPPPIDATKEAPKTAPEVNKEAPPVSAEAQSNQIKIAGQQKAKVAIDNLGILENLKLG